MPQGEKSSCPDKQNSIMNIKNAETDRCRIPISARCSKRPAGRPLPTMNSLGIIWWRPGKIPRSTKDSSPVLWKPTRCGPKLHRCSREAASESGWGEDPIGIGPRCDYLISMNILLLLVVLLLLSGGGGFYLGGPVIGGSAFGLILLVCIVVYFAGGFRGSKG